MSRMLYGAAAAAIITIAAYTGFIQAFSPKHPAECDPSKASLKSSPEELASIKAKCEKSAL